MNTLTYDTLRASDYEGYLLENAPERVLQFGEGNFLRAFVDDFIDRLNECAGFDGKVVLVQPIAPGLAGMINDQQGLYTLYLRGFADGQAVDEKRVISCVSRCLNPYDDFDALLACAKNPDLRFIVSNTTEAGIVYDANSTFDQRPPHSFPAKLTRFLYERFQNGLSGFIVLSCELIDDNGRILRECVLRHAAEWKLGEAFSRWIEGENTFCSTLVDRIVTGYPRAEADALNAKNGYTDNLIDTGECFGLWVIEGPQSLLAELPFDRAGLPVIVTDDHSPYKQRKVRILNGSHTSMVLGAYLAGFDIVRDCMHDDIVRGFMEKAIFDEIIPTLSLPRDELIAFAQSVTDRYQNPFIDHKLLDIALNSTAKWRARVLPSVKGYLESTGKPPRCLSFSLAAYLAFYRAGEALENGTLVARRGDDSYAIRDDEWVLEWFLAHRHLDAAALTRELCRNERMWGEDLTALPGFAEAVASSLEAIDRDGMRDAMRACV